MDFLSYNEEEDRWLWTLSANGKFSSKVLSDLVRSKLIASRVTGLETLRNNFVPKKVGIFIWQALKGRLPVLSELDKRGIDLHSVLCPICEKEIETVQHALFQCEKSKEVWDKTHKWFDMVCATLDSSKAFRVNSSFQTSNIGLKIWQAIEWTCGYLIWKNRNKVVFKKLCWNPPLALNEIQVKSFEWIAKRCKSKSIEWHSWLTNPKCIVI
ncbi:uncharacterized protein [Rutidosis leptorrhynchoides]|uniref:uncharacterized protein n=1 Tax=Rutidosis leptorrhynchoides TaxID=125765 RepID=UPI003A9A2A49